ncbi:nuclear protein localization protein 4 [Trichomonascus vanleenenianus]|uniref:nuclear protein localization protein 4 n=1 Tax=Trichomonascus vanleenenianus TaxID=2268995 RepID=UPI003EC95457
MLIRFRSKDGMFRVQAEPSTPFIGVLKKLSEDIPKADMASARISSSPSDPGRFATDLSASTVGALDIKHGDLLFVTYSDRQEDSSMETDRVQGTQGAVQAERAPGRQQGMTAQETFESVKQLPIDDLLDKKDGKIKRPRDPKMCRHGDKGMCDYCMPLEPYDLGYQEEHNIKHLSFHAYLRELNATSNKTGSASSYMAPLTEPYYGTAKFCPSGHPPWPEGICSKCQPSAITLQQQQFRMVDHVEFSDPGIINTFIDSWRQSGTQRIGFMYGRYEEYDIVPLGIKAVVEAVYEPPQHDETDGVSWNPNEDEQAAVDRAAELLGLQRVGVIYTDLTDAGEGTGSVICRRHVDSYFLSSVEVAFAAQLQRMHPAASRWSSSGKFSSKFVTCVVSGNAKGEIDISSYQASASAEAMVAADLIEPSANPSVMRIKEPSSTRYVPEVFYKRINEYKRAVNENAKPAFPVEYLLVTLTHGFPEAPKPQFSTLSFPVENRAHLGASQDFAAVARQLNLSASSGDDTSLSAISDFHLLCYLFSLSILGRDEEQLLANVAKSQSLEDGYKLLESAGWQTLLTIIREST